MLFMVVEQRLTYKRLEVPMLNRYSAVNNANCVNISETK